MTPAVFTVTLLPLSVPVNAAILLSLLFLHLLLCPLLTFLSKNSAEQQVLFQQLLLNLFLLQWRVWL